MERAGGFFRASAAFLKKIWHNPQGRTGLILIAVLAAVALLAPVLAPYDPYDVALRDDKGLAPSAEHLLGTSITTGQDVFSMLLYGTRVSMCIGIVTGLAIAFLGSILGVAAGYAGIVADTVIMRLVDIQLCFPFTLLALFIAAVLGSSLGNVILIAGITSWVRYARLVRGEILGIKEMEYIEAIRAAGGTDARIIFKHILPNIISPVIVIATLEMAKIVLIEASLSFLGYGVPITIPTWGRMLSEARDNILTDPWQCIFPGLCITLTVLGVNLLGDWLRDYLDPKLDV